MQLEVWSPSASALQDYSLRAYLSSWSGVTKNEVYTLISGDTFDLRSTLGEAVKELPRLVKVTVSFPVTT